MSSSSAGRTIESLERRVLLSATLLTQIPDQMLSTTAGAPPAISLGSYFSDPSITSGDTVVDIQTNLPAPDNNIVLMLTDAATPITVANFLQYISSGEYANTIIHRSIPGFIIQGGGDYTDNSTVNNFGPIQGESATATLKNTTGTIAMALTGTPSAPAPNSGSAEWFINLADNPQLDDTSDGGPFTAFGSVIYGMDTVNAIAALPVYDGTSISGEWANLPLQNYDSSTGLTNDNFVIITPSVVTNFLSYSAISSNPNIVSAAVSGSNLTLTPGSNGGSANITVTATDLGGGTAVSNFTVTVTNSTNPPPVASADTASTVSGVPVIINVLANDTPAGQINAASVLIATTPADGTVSVNSDGTITYTPSNGFTGNDSFSYTVASTAGAVSSPAYVSVNVLAPPTANTDTANTTRNTSVVIDVLANDTASLGINTATVQVATIPSDGTATANSDGTITYTPNNNFVGQDSFTYTFDDAEGNVSNSASVTVDTGVTIAAPGPRQSLPTSLTFTEADGTAAVITLRGPGTAAVYINGSASSSVTKSTLALTGANLSVDTITTTGTTVASVLTITTKGGTKFVNVGGLTTQSLKSLVAKGVTFTGDLTAGGSIASLMIAGAAGGTISAASIATLTDSANFSDNLTLAGGASLGTFTAASVPGGTWSIAGSAKLLNVTKGDLDATITAASIGAIRIKGNLAGTLNLTAPGTDLTTLAVTGSIQQASITAAGNIGAISATSLTNSEIYAGIGDLPVGQVLPNTATDFVAASSIKSVNLKTVKGVDTFSNSDIAAALLGNLSLGTIQTNNSGNPTGVAAENIATLTATANKKFTLKKLTSATNLSALLTTDGVTITPDFQIDLIGG